MRDHRFSGGYSRDNYYRQRAPEPYTPPPPPRPTGPPAAEHIRFKGKYYDKARLIAHLGSGKKIKVNKEELHEKAYELVDTSRAGRIEQAVPVVTPYEGKYVVIFAGDVVIGEEPVNAIMIPNMLLKKTFLWDADQ